MSRGRGRPRQFDETAVREAIVDCFRSKGFAATSLDDLARATGLVRPSLYAAFGSKEQMFLGAMDDFAARILRRLEAEPPAAPSPEAALKSLFEAALEVYLDGDGALGCLVFTTATADAPTHPEIRARLFDQIVANDALFQRVLARHAPQATPRVLEVASGLAAATLHSLGIRARAGADRAPPGINTSSRCPGVAALLTLPPETVD